MPRYQNTFTLCLLSLSGLGLTNGSDLASKRLLNIAEKETQIYQKIAENPEFYSEDDLDRRINELVQSYRTYLLD